MTRGRGKFKDPHNINNPVNRKNSCALLAGKISVLRKYGSAVRAWLAQEGRDGGHIKGKKLLLLKNTLQ